MRALQGHAGPEGNLDHVGCDACDTQEVAEQNGWAAADSADTNPGFSRLLEPCRPDVDLR